MNRFEWPRDGIISPVGLMLVPPDEVAQMIENGNIEQVGLQNLFTGYSETADCIGYLILRYSQIPESENRKL